jgi:hypothetical protein
MVGLRMRRLTRVALPRPLPHSACLGVLTGRWIPVGAAKWRAVDRGGDG